VPDLLLAPYVVLKTPVTVGPWQLVPFREFQQDDDDSEDESRAWVPDALRVPVVRLVQAYGVGDGGAALGAVVVPKRGQAGDPFDRGLMSHLGHALLAGSVADNPLMALPEDEESLNAGHAGATSENALVYGHPLGGGESYVIETGVLFRVTSYRHAPDDEPLPEIEPPVELPRPIFGKFDEEVADAAHDLLSAGDAQARRFQRALDWYRIALSNAEAVTLDVRVGAARSAIEVLAGESDETKKVVRAYGRIMGTDETAERTYTADDVQWAKGPVQLTPDEWWLTRLSALRNAIVHGDVLAHDDALWYHEGHHQLNHLHDRLIGLLKRVIADHAGDELLRLTMGERVFPRIAEDLVDHMREAREADTAGDHEEPA
jgi:hypothetical protein